MNEVVIRDVPIRFPFKPYKVQEDYMSKVLECLQQGVNGVLESPTGTGKTLSLLCASLAWLQVKKAQQQANAQGLLLNTDVQEAFNKSLQNELQKSAGVSESLDSAWSKMLSAPRIVYATRTHSQLTQVIKELKRTSYNHVKATVLGSRDQLCLHPDLAEEHGFMKVTLCRTKVKGKACHYYNNMEMKRNSVDKTTAVSEVTDIEDLVKLGQKTQCCPYYTARDMMEQADIVFMPYNYLLDPHTRRAQRISLDNAVVILDEAHNVEKTCEEAASIHISSTEIALCIGDVTQAMKKFAEVEKVNQESGQEFNQDFSMEELCVLKTMFLALEGAIDDIKLDTVDDGPNRPKKSAKTFPGSYVFDILAKAEIVMSKLPVLDECLTKLAQFISTTSDSPLSKKGGSLLRFNEFLKVVYESCGKEGKGDTNLYYKVHIEQEVPKKNKPDSWSNTKTVINNKAKVINFWCFSPGFAMRSMLSQGVHCVILTSGTLAPLNATISELGIPVPVTLENPHIIKSDQISVMVMSKGPMGEKLISNYNNRENPKYLGDLGRIVSNFSRVIPDGVLVFFPSYPMMEKTVNYWQLEGLWSQINSIKPLFVEPQNRDSLNDMLREYHRTLEAEGSTGAVLLAVMRGKVSEGMDFADAHARAVLVTGLPYPPFKDPRVVLKQDYVDNARKTNPQGLTGRQWYELDAVRAVNQAVGRVIRHSSDFGAIILCDCRFESPTITNTLSAWLRAEVVKCAEFRFAYGKVSKFFKAMGINPPQKPVNPGASFDYIESKVRLKEVTKDKLSKENSQAATMSFFEKFKTGEKKISPLPKPKGLLEALEKPSISAQKNVDILKAVYDNSREEHEPYVQPAPKRRKLKIVPLNFDVNSEMSPSRAGVSSAAASNSNQAERTKATIEYVKEVKSRISVENFGQFKEVVKSYANSKDSSYEKTVLCLRKVFPDSSTKDLFIGFKRYIKPDHMDQFKELCFRMFGSTS